MQPFHNHRKLLTRIICDQQVERIFIFDADPISSALKLRCCKKPCCPVCAHVPLLMRKMETFRAVFGKRNSQCDGFMPVEPPTCCASDRPSCNTWLCDNRFLPISVLAD